MKYIVGLLLLLFCFTASKAQSTVNSIPNQKLINGSYVSNPDKILDATTVTQIDTLLKALESKTTAQVAVVVLQSIGEADIFEFAQELFTTWGIGQKQSDNGLLLLFVNDQRTVRFHTGFGLEGALTDAMCKRIQRDFMVPEFKNGNYNAGMLAGLQQVNKILTDPKYAEELKEPEKSELSGWQAFVTLLAIFVLPVLIYIYYRKSSDDKFADSKDFNEAAYPEMYMKRWPWLFMYVGVPALIVVLFGISGSGDDRIIFCFTALYSYYLLTRFHRLRRMKKVIKRFLKNQEYYETVEFIRKQQWHWFWMAVLFPFPFLFYFFYHLARKRIYRNYPRTCKQCQTGMAKLGEKNEDEYLSAGMQMEEKLNVVDYDVWKCKNQSCNGIEIWHYITRQTKYQSCPKCETMAYHFVNSRTVTSASYTSSGLGERVDACKFCMHQNVAAYTIPMYVEDNSSSSSFSSSSSSSSDSGSWGGGSSGGGGASSSW